MVIWLSRCLLKGWMPVLNIDKVQVYACTSKSCGPKAQTDLDTSGLFFFFLLLGLDDVIERRYHRCGYLSWRFCKHRSFTRILFKLCLWRREVGSFWLKPTNSNTELSNDPYIASLNKMQIKTFQLWCSHTRENFGVGPRHNQRYSNCVQWTWDLFS